MRTLLARLRCLLRGRHEPQRYPLGGFRCLDCSAKGADLDEMGFFGSGYVAPSRAIYDRAERSITRDTYDGPAKGEPDAGSRGRDPRAAAGGRERSAPAVRGGGARRAEGRRVAKPLLH